MARRWPLGLILIGMLIAAAGCADNGDERAFAPPANATGPARFGTPGLPSSEQATPTALATAVPTMTTAQLLRPRGAPARFYFRAGSDLWTMAADGQATPLLRPESGAVAAFSASPSGDAVAALIEEGRAGQGGSDLVVLAANGEERWRYADVQVLLPGAADSAVATSLDWSPQGTRLLIAFSSGALVEAAADGSTAPVVLGVVPGATPTAARWSPTGEDVAVLAGRGAEDATVLLLALGATPEPARPLLETTTPRTASSLSWSPDGRAILVVDRPVDGGLATSGDLWRIEVENGQRRLVASAGAAPAARIGLVQPSPNGGAVAYMVRVAEGGVDRFHSLWVKELASERVIEIPVPPEVAVTDIWWTSFGLIFRTVPGATASGGYDSGPFDLYRVDDGIEPRRIFSLTGDDIGTPLAVASPSAGAMPATPGPSGTEATPAASAATPFGSEKVGSERDKD